MWDCTLGNQQCQGTASHYTTVTKTNTIYGFKKTTKKYTKIQNLLFMNNNNWWFHIQVCGHDDLVLNVYWMYVPNPNGHMCGAGMASFWRRGDVATWFWRWGGITVVSCARWDSSDRSTEELKVDNCYHNDVLPTPTRSKVTSTCCPKDSKVEMSFNP